MIGEHVEPGDIIVKDTEVLRNLLERRYHPLLIKIIEDIAKEHGLVITCGYREPMHPSDIHATNPCRAIDIRSWVYPEHQAKEIEREINRRWQYDPRRENMVASMIHAVKDGHVHFHLQTHPRTIRKAI